MSPSGGNRYFLNFQIRAILLLITALYKKTGLSEHYPVNGEGCLSGVLNSLKLLFVVSKTCSPENFKKKLFAFSISLSKTPLSTKRLLTIHFVAGGFS